MNIQSWMRSLTGFALFVGISAPALAGERPTAEVAVSYCLLSDSTADGTLPLGWSAAVAGNVTDWLGIVGEVAGHYKSFGDDVVDDVLNVNIHTFLAGPRFASRRSSRVTPFAQVLLGAGRASAGADGFNFSDTAFAVESGGGVDVAITRRVGLRLQGAYLAIRNEGETIDSGRVAIGLAIALGRQ